MGAVRASFHRSPDGAWEAKLFCSGQLAHLMIWQPGQTRGSSSPRSFLFVHLTEVQETLLFEIVGRCLARAQELYATPPDKRLTVWPLLAEGAPSAWIESWEDAPETE